MRIASMPARPSIAAVIEPASPPPIMTTSVFCIGRSLSIQGWSAAGFADVTAIERLGPRAQGKIEAIAAREEREGVRAAGPRVEPEAGDVAALAPGPHVAAVVERARVDAVHARIRKEPRAVVLE